jgi:hypothetical protein
MNDRRYCTNGCGREVAEPFDISMDPWPFCHNCAEDRRIWLAANPQPPETEVQRTAREFQMFWSIVLPLDGEGS